MSNVLDLVCNPQFNANQYVVEHQKRSFNQATGASFQRAVKQLEEYLNQLEKSMDATEYQRRQRAAIIGEPAAVNFFLEKIERFLLEHNAYRSIKYPPYYESIADALFQETLGFGPMAAWFRNPTQGAKVNGTAILHDINGKYVKMPYRYSSIKQVERLIRSITLIDETKQVSAVSTTAEVEMADGTRVAIIAPPTVKEPVLTFRQYRFGEYTFEHQAEKRTIDKQAIPLFKALSRTMMNIVATGPVKSGKTTLLKVIYGVRDPDLIVVTLEVDSYEIRLGKDFPERKEYLHELVVTEEESQKIFRELLRHDADYIVVPEVRSFEVEPMLKSAERGGGYLSTYHESRNLIDIPSEFASEILNVYPTRSHDEQYVRAAKSLDVVISIVRGKGGRKIVTGVYYYDYDQDAGVLHMIPWVKYNRQTDDWVYNFDIPDSLETRYMEDCPDDGLVQEYMLFKRELQRLAELKPMRSAARKTKRVRGERH